MGNRPLTNVDPSGMSGDILFYPVAIQYDLTVAGAVNGFTFGYACGYLDAFYSGSPNPTVEALAMAAAGAAIGAAVKVAPQEFGLLASVSMALEGVKSIGEAYKAKNMPLFVVRTACFTAAVGYTAYQSRGAIGKFLAGEEGSLRIPGGKKQKKGTRWNENKNAEEQLQGLEDAAKKAIKKRPSIDQGEWEGSKKRPKQNDIQSGKKSDDRADHKRGLGGTFLD